MEFKDRIKQLRQDENMTLTDLGAKLGKTESACRAWELGRTKPDADTLIELSNFFKCSTDYLLGLSEYKNSKEVQTVLRGYKFVFENLEELKNRKYESLLNAVGESMNFVLTNTLDNDTWYRLGHSDVSECFRTTLLRCLSMCKAAADLDIALKEHGVDISDAIYKVEFDVALITDFINSKSIFNGAVSNCYESLRKLLLISIDNDDTRDALAKILFNQYSNIE